MRSSINIQVKLCVDSEFYKLHSIFSKILYTNFSPFDCSRGERHISAMSNQIHLLLIKPISYYIHERLHQSVTKIFIAIFIRNGLGNVFLTVGLLLFNQRSLQLITILKEGYYKYSAAKKLHQTVKTSRIANVYDSFVI